MRWIALTGLAVLFSGATALGQTDSSPSTAPKKAPKTPTSLPSPTAEPENGQAYLPPAPREEAGPSEADVGPVLKHFTRASTTDDLEETQDTGDGARPLPEKVALDKRITVPKIHDVQNDGPNSRGENHAMAYEIDYLNWGAITNEQLMARRGHYFTITWKNNGPKSDFTAVFEYREVKSKEIVRQLVQPAHAISGATRSYFAVVDKAYQAYGPVVSWRFTVRKGDTVVAEAKSFIW